MTVRDQLVRHSLGSHIVLGKALDACKKIFRLLFVYVPLRDPISSGVLTYTGGYRMILWYRGGL